MHAFVRTVGSGIVGIAVVGEPSLNKAENITGPPAPQPQVTRQEPKHESELHAHEEFYIAVRREVCDVDVAAATNDVRTVTLGSTHAMLHVSTRAPYNPSQDYPVF